MKLSFRNKIFCFLLTPVFLLAFAQAGFSAKATDKTPAGVSDAKAKPVIRVQELTYDFGQIQEGTEVSHDYIVKNEGNAALNIERVKVG